jgi:hypothetical protein
VFVGFESLSTFFPSARTIFTFGDRIPFLPLRTTFTFDLFSFEAETEIGVVLELLLDVAEKGFKLDAGVVVFSPESSNAKSAFLGAGDIGLLACRGNSPRIGDS